MRSSDGEGRSIRSDALCPALSGEWEVPVPLKDAVEVGEVTILIFPARTHLLAEAGAARIRLTGSPEGEIALTAVRQPSERFSPICLLPSMTGALGRDRRWMPASFSATGLELCPYAS